MINYELVQKLKAAGFPQEYKNTNKKMYGKLAYIFGLKGLKIRPRPTIKQFNQMEFVGLDVVCIPTLSELIEACGEDYKTKLKITDDHHKVHYNTSLYFHLRKKYNRSEESKWVATFEHSDVPRISWKEGEGSTPEESVANLWLSLNEKK